jgi:hypothetical protein
MPATLDKPAASAADRIGLADVIMPGRSYEFGHLLKLISGVDTHDLQKQFGGSHVAGSAVLDWAARSTTKAIRVKPELAQRLSNARNAAASAAGTSRTIAHQTAAAVLAETEDTPPPVAPPAKAPAAQDDPASIAFHIKESRWYSPQQLMELLDGIDRHTFTHGFPQANPVQLTGSEVLHGAAIAARQGKPWTVKKSVVAEIMARRAAVRAQRAKMIEDIRREASQLIARHEQLTALAATVDELKAEEAAVKAKHAKAIAEIDAAVDARMNAQRAGDMARMIPPQLYALAARAPDQFEPREPGDLPRLRELPPAAD